MAGIEREPRAEYAVIGVGALAEAIVDGLCRGAAPSIVLSPRGRERAARLVGRHRSVEVAADNQAAVDAADTVLICVRPQDAPAVLDALRFGEQQRVVSVMASTTLAELADRVAPAHAVSRAIPTPAVADHQGVTPVHPPDSAAHHLFAQLGRTVELADERLLDVVQIASATVSTHFSYLATISGWLAGQGVEPAQADDFLSGLFVGLSGALSHGAPFDDLRSAHATRGGLNERLERGLREAGMFDLLTRGLDDLLADPLDG